MSHRDEDWASRDASSPYSPLEGDTISTSLNPQRGSHSGGVFDDEQDIVMNVSEFLQLDRPRETSGRKLRGGGHSTGKYVSVADDDDSASLGGSRTTIDSFLFGSSSPSRRRLTSSDGNGAQIPLLGRVKLWCNRIPRIAAVLLLPVYVGCVMAMFALDRRRRALPLFINERDWLILFMIGVASQLSLVPFVLNCVVPDAHDTFSSLHSPSDYYAPFVLYPISSVFFCIVAVAYAILDKKAQRKNRVEVSLRRRSKLQTIYAHLTSCVEFRSEISIPFIIVLSGLFCVSCRFCTSSSGVECSGVNQLWDPRHLSEPIFYSAVTFQFCMYVCLCGLSTISIGMYWQHQRLVRVFTFPEKFGARSAASSSPGSRALSGERRRPSPTAHTRLLDGGGGGKARGTSSGGATKRKGFVKEIDWHDLSNPEGISNYIVLYQQIIGSMNHHPVITSICTPSFASSVVIFVVSLAVVVVDNMYQGHGFADFTFVFMSLMTISAAVISLFIALTVQLDKTIGLQSRIIAKVQNDVQQVIDARRKRWATQLTGGVFPGGGEMRTVNLDDEEEGYDADGRRVTMKLLEAKVNALQALDVYVRIADSTPKLIGMSLNTIRWATILSLLLFINFFFVLLYRIYCFDEPPNDGITRTPTLPMLEELFHTPLE